MVKAALVMLVAILALLGMLVGVMLVAVGAKPPVVILLALLLAAVVLTVKGKQ